MSELASCSAVSDITSVDWNNYLREDVVTALNVRRRTKIGGEEKIVEIDERLFTKLKNSGG
jgi:hypothetical protein